MKQTSTQFIRYFS